MPRKGYRQLVGKIAAWRQEQREQEVRELAADLHANQRAAERDLTDIAIDTFEVDRDAS